MSAGVISGGVALINANGVSAAWLCARHGEKEENEAGGLAQPASSIIETQ
jgi:hypothetical protein